MSPKLVLASAAASERLERGKTEQAIELLSAISALDESPVFLSHPDREAATNTFNQSQTHETHNDKHNSNPS